MSRSEKSILNAALVSVSALPETMIWRNNTGMAWSGTQVPTRPGSTVVIRPGMVVLMDARPVRFGLAGSGDILGVSKGRALAIECKTLTGRQSVDQGKFQRAFEAAGGVYVLARHEDDACNAVRRL